MIEERIDTDSYCKEILKVEEEIAMMRRWLSRLQAKPQRDRDRINSLRLEIEERKEFLAELKKKAGQ